MQEESRDGFKVLVVDDEPDVVDIITLNLQAIGMDVITAFDGLEAIKKACLEKPNVIILDLMLPKLSGLEVCREIRKTPDIQNTPILMLTARAEAQDREAGFASGADDYIPKPFSTKELQLRIETIFHRLQKMRPDKDSPILKIDGIEIDEARQEVKINGNPVQFSEMEFKLLHALASRRGLVFTRDQLLSEVWGRVSILATRTVDTHIRRVRSKLGNMANLVESVHGFGYRMKL